MGRVLSSLAGIGPSGFAWDRIQGAMPASLNLSDDSITISLHAKKIYDAGHKKSRPKAAFRLDRYNLRVALLRSLPH
jgi:hypothetical protein